jgi:hypothetical protein
MDQDKKLQELPKDDLNKKSCQYCTSTTQGVKIVKAEEIVLLEVNSIDP